MYLFYLYAKFLKKLRGSAVLNSNINNFSKVESGSQIINSTFDRYSFCGYDCEVINTHIGAFCSIGNHVKIGGAMHPLDWVSTSPVFYYGRDSIKKKFSQNNREEDKVTIIGHDVWIGENVMIKQGVKVGNGAIIGMGAIVTKDVKPYSIVAGNPAMIIRYRFSSDIIERLNNSKWWLYEDRVIAELAEFIKSPEDFLNYFEKKYGKKDKH